MTLPLFPSYREISLTKGLVAIVDQFDFELVSVHRWYAKWSECTQSFYAATSISVSGKSKTLRMHRLILSISDPRILCDHANQDTLDNRRSNLRVATYQENNRNHRLRKDNRSGFTGVCWFSPKAKWRAYVYLDGKQKHLGYFTDVGEARKAQVAAAKELYGEFKPSDMIVTALG